MTVITKEQKEAQDKAESMNRKERRNLGKRMKKDLNLSFTPKIPGSQQPFSKKHAKWTPYGNDTTEETS